MGRGPWPTVITLAGIAAVICLVGWPRPTLAALAGVAAAAVLVFGIRLLLTERRPAPAAVECAGCAGCGGPDCAERPDPSGPDPDATPTDPDPAGPHAADQPGHDPDNARTVPATEYQRVRLMLRASRDVRARLSAELADAKEQLRKAEQADAALARVRELADRWARGYTQEQPYARSLDAALNGTAAKAGPDDIGTSAWLLRAVNEHQASRNTPGTADGSSR